MKFLVIVKGSKSCEAGEPPSAESIAAMGQYNDALAKAGVLLACEALHPTSEGKRVRLADKSCTVTDGPFTETKELVSGYWLWECASMQEAEAWARKCPNPHPEQPFDIEIRRIRQVDGLSQSRAA